MYALKTLQNAFQHYLLTHQTTDLLSHIGDDPLFSNRERLFVYYDAYRLRLLEVLQLDFPKTLILMGETLFQAAFEHYLVEHPSHHFSVRYFGQHFPAFLAQKEPYQSSPAFSEMATFEWHLSYTLDASDAPTLSLSDLAPFAPKDWPDLQFTFHPSVISHCFAWDVPQIWQAIDQESAYKPPSLQPEGRCWLFWRKDLRSFFQSCLSSQAILYQGIRHKHTFAELCDMLLAEVPEDEIPLITAQTLHTWLEQGLLSYVSKT